MLLPKCYSYDQMREGEGGGGNVTRLCGEKENFIVCGGET